MSLIVKWPDDDNKDIKISDVSSELKDYIIEYVGNKLDPEDNTVTVEMVVNVLADEFPEVALSLAEENWVRGYEQGIEDLKAFGVEE